MDFDAEIQMFQKNFDLWNLTTELVNYDSLSLSLCSHFSDFRDWVCKNPCVVLRRKWLLQREISKSVLCCWSKLQ